MQGYLAALSASSYSYVSMLQHFGPIMNAGSAAISLTYLASEKIIPGTPPSPRRPFLIATWNNVEVSQHRMTCVPFVLNCMWQFSSRVEESTYNTSKSLRL